MKFQKYSLIIIYPFIHFISFFVFVFSFSHYFFQVNGVNMKLITSYSCVYHPSRT